MMRQARSGNAVIQMLVWVLALALPGAIPSRAQTGGPGAEVTLSGTVKTPDGKPAAQAEVILCDNPAGAYQFTGNAKTDPLFKDAPKDAKTITTAADGKFAFKTAPKYFNLIIRHESGALLLSDENFKNGAEVTLPAWGRIEGIFLDGTKPRPGEYVQIAYPARLASPESGEASGMIPRVYYYYTTKTDKKGRFVFDRIQPGSGKIGWMANRVDGLFTFMNVYPVEIRAGETTQYQLGGKGRAVTGRLALAAGSLPFSRWQNCEGIIFADRPKTPPEIARQGRVAVAKWRMDWEATPEGRRQAPLKDYFQIIRVSKKGQFRIPDVPAGKFSVRFIAYQDGANGMSNSEPIAGISRVFEVPPMPSGRSDTPLDLGALELAIPKVPQVGDLAPDFTCPALEGGKPVALQDFRGKYVLLDFWATWCGPCRAEVPNLKTVHERFGGDGRLVMLSLSLDDDKAEPQKYVKENGLNWHQGFLGEWAKDQVTKKYGVDGIPAIYLLGPDGKILAMGLRGEELIQAVEKKLGKKEQ